VVLASGAPATLVETLPWMNGPHADVLRASIAAHDPSQASAPAPDVPAAWIAQGPTAGEDER
jgi:hypothetical protein